MEILIDVTNSMNEISIVCAQNDVEIVQEYLTDNDEHHHSLNPENGEQNIVLSSVLDQKECDEGEWKVNQFTVIVLCHILSKHGYFVNMGTK